MCTHVCVRVHVLDVLIKFEHKEGITHACAPQCAEPVCVCVRACVIRFVLVRVFVFTFDVRPCVRECIE